MAAESISSPHVETRALHLLDCFREAENKGAERTGQLPEEEPAGGKLVNKWKQREEK